MNESITEIHVNALKKWALIYLVKKIADFANSTALDVVAHNEPPHLDLHCLPSSL